MGKAQVIYCWFVRDVTVAMLVEASLSSGIHVNSIVSTPWPPCHVVAYQEYVLLTLTKLVPSRRLDIGKV